MNNAKHQPDQVKRGTQPLRADARRNRDQLLAAARDLFVEQGADVPLEEVARRAGVGIGTLYRRFPDRQALMRAVALDVLARVQDDADRAIAEEPTPFLALARYMHRALDVRIAGVMPAIVGQLPMEEADLSAARDSAALPLVRIIETAQADGSLRPDVSFGDIGLLILRLSQPLPIPLPAEQATEIMHRHLDLLLDGLRSDHRSEATLPGPALTLDDLKQLDPNDAQR